MNLFVFDIETVPDVESGRRLHDLQDLSDHDVAEAMYAKRREANNGNDFLRHHQHKVVAISLVMRSNNNLKVWSLGNEDSDEKDILSRFFAGIDRYRPTMVSWNGSGFDFPVLHYRAMRHGIVAPFYWEMGETDQTFRWNNYLNRFHFRHTDLMDVIAGYQPRANAPLTEIASMLGFPGKMGMSGSKVWETYQQEGGLKKIRNYCETDVLNTYLVYLHFERMRGKLSNDNYAAELQRLRETLKTEDKPHFTEFLENWEVLEPAESEVVE